MDEGRLACVIVQRAPDLLMHDVRAASVTSVSGQTVAKSSSLDTTRPG
ncbi:MAG TPA: hypothetical protein VFY23_04215 [Candidatus Limnocylindrales bacterium]|nr:hypothetical protein [Candidatus Limnocylindrales bacterium]